jgi:voltage-gated potassium channel
MLGSIWPTVEGVLMSWSRLVRHTVVLGLILVVYFMTPVRADVNETAAIRIAISLLCLGLLGFGVVWTLRRQVDDTSRRIDGLIAVILVVIFAFSMGFYILEERRPGEVAGLDTRLDSLYFTVSTLMTIGYGDVHAQGQVARALVLVQILFDAVFVAAAAGLLSARIRSRARARSEERTGQEKPG